MRSLFAFTWVAVWVCLAAESPAAAPGDAPTDEALQLANRGQVDRAIQVLRDYLNANSRDVRARVVLGRILDFDGRPDEAVTLWEGGLTGTESDFPLLMSIGEIRLRQGRDGPMITYRRGMVGAIPSKNEADADRYTRSRLAEALAAYEKAVKLRPEEPEVAKALASVYTAQGKHDSAAQVWASLVQRAPDRSEYHLGLALAKQKAGRSKEAAQDLRKAIELNPRLAAAHQALAEIQQQQGQAAEAEQSRKRAEFYDRLPAFCTLAYSEENQKRLDSLDQEESVRKLINDPSEAAAELLATLCWSHPHNVLEAEAFAALEARGAATTPLLRALLAGAQSTCTIKSAAHILARRKADGLFESLVRMLPGDVRGLAMDMDIAGSLDDLGDPRAVGPLVEVLDLGGADDAGEDQLLTDRVSARARAAMALGAFDTPEARRALDAGTRKPRIAAYCLAARYRLTRDPKDLAALETSVRPDERYAKYVLGNYLLAKVATDPAKKLARTWEQQLAAQRAADEARAKREAATKSRKDR
jgi:tetratricopeptide (TPR) repeat protein